MRGRAVEPSQCRREFAEGTSRSGCSILTERPGYSQSRQSCHHASVYCPRQSLLRASVTFIATRQLPSRVLPDAASVRKYQQVSSVAGVKTTTNFGRAQEPHRCSCTFIWRAIVHGDALVDRGCSVQRTKGDADEIDEWASRKMLGESQANRQSHISYTHPSPKGTHVAWTEI
jgi:hypothetical protein